MSFLVFYFLLVVILRPNRLIWAFRAQLSHIQPVKAGFEDFSITINLLRLKAIDSAITWNWTLAIPLYLVFFENLENVLSKGIRILDKKWSNSGFLSSSFVIRYSMF